MPRHGKLDLGKIRASLAVVCPHCSARIEPEQQNWIDAEHMKCPWCDEKFVPKRAA